MSSSVCLSPTSSALPTDADPNSPAGHHGPRRCWPWFPRPCTTTPLISYWLIETHWVVRSWHCVCIATPGRYCGRSEFHVHSTNNSHCTWNRFHINGSNNKPPITKLHLYTTACVQHKLLTVIHYQLLKLLLACCVIKDIIERNTVLNWPQRTRCSHKLSSSCSMLLSSNISCLTVAAWQTINNSSWICTVFITGTYFNDQQHY